VIGSVAAQDIEVESQLARDVAVQEKPSSSAPQPVTCDALLQHPLAWWLGNRKWQFE
jgi:hypothetical protein